ncbi:hypothetical protein PVNG_00485 [Plasmodium vivax North Korean]|uniref:TRIP4/RQT4 C2HC5-type zinc finger domain-containing protein n=1 Tax=Plasmodium vivax North Korean TaxID=1035514 RepID=A0A0J9WBL4_PLAVI|nr:hypothetical protein PVNG_00485 [Plasmodium vivax North Korean]
MDEKDKYANHIRKKIIKFFNLKNEELDLSYIKSILNCKSYDLYGSIYLLNESFYENGRNEKCSLSTVQKFTQELVDDKKRFILSSEDDSVGGATQGGSSYGQTTNHGVVPGDGIPRNCVEGKTINSYFEEVFKREDVPPSRKGTSGGVPHEDKHGKVLPNRSALGKVKRVGQMEGNQNKDKPRRSANDATTHGGEHPLDVAVRLANETEPKKAPAKVNKEKSTKRGGHSPGGDKPNGVAPQKGEAKETQGKEAQPRGAAKLEAVEHGRKDSRTQLEEDQTKSQTNSKGKAESDYFAFFNMKENSYSLKTVINFIESDQAKGGEQKEQAKEEKKKKKHTQICICSGRSHQIYANCLFCGKVYCTKIKYRQCLFCGNPLYDSSLINSLFTPTEDGENAHKKILATMKSSNPFLYKNYFDPSNAFLKKGSSKELQFCGRGLLECARGERPRSSR